MPVPRMHVSPPVKAGAACCSRRDTPGCLEPSGHGRTPRAAAVPEWLTPGAVNPIRVE